ncbi:Uncharacterized protein OBRU01_09406 [Operophtera brumata]|uniref:DUF7041 domain-containing protein n=1 Tax=Operophtera brumata TaxID=104452 RepID=A0A0L7LFF1_OPEBR|nr:Uncharacterized protein OBRU01_09406 [Operophtera brumata]
MPVDGASGTPAACAGRGQLGAQPASSMQPGADLAAISVSARIPEFWAEMPRLWFAQFDAVMEPQKQGDSTKYNLVIAKLNRDALQQFETIKERLLAVYEESAEKQFHNLVSGMDLETQRPSQLLRKMSGLATNTQIPTEALRRLWISRLPTAVRTILTVTPEAKLDDLAKIADKIIENMNIGEVCAMGNATVPDMTDQLARMTMELKSLREEINEVRGRSRSRGDGWRRERSQSRGNSRGPGSTNWLCRFHYRWRARARTCEQPCNWKQPGASRADNTPAAGTQGVAGASAAPSN